MLIALILLRELAVSVSSLPYVPDTRTVATTETHH